MNVCMFKLLLKTPTPQSSEDMEEFYVVHSVVSDE